MAELYNEGLSPDDNMVMRATFKATMLRAADIIDKISEDDVLQAQTRGLSEGMTLQQVSRIDRAMVASAYLRLCASGKAKL
jgi:hypothetical protein